MSSSERDIASVSGEMSGRLYKEDMLHVSMIPRAA
jgi:hypothetical protein